MRYDTMFHVERSDFERKLKVGEEKLFWRGRTRSMGVLLDGGGLSFMLAWSAYGIQGVLNGRIERKAEGYWPVGRSLPCRFAVRSLPLCPWGLEGMYVGWPGSVGLWGS